jgi:hypothetical protein
MTAVYADIDLVDAHHLADVIPDAAIGFATQARRQRA